MLKFFYQVLTVNYTVLLLQIIIANLNCYYSSIGVSKLEESVQQQVKKFDSKIDCVYYNKGL